MYSTLETQTASNWVFRCARRPHTHQHVCVCVMCSHAHTHTHSSSACAQTCSKCASERNTTYLTSCFTPKAKSVSRRCSVVMDLVCPTTRTHTCYPPQHTYTQSQPQYVHASVYFLYCSASLFLLDLFAYMSNVANRVAFRVHLCGGALAIR